MTTSTKIKGGVIVLRHAYLDHFQDPVVAIVCSQLHFHYMPSAQGGSKLTHKIGNHWWVVKTYDDWMAETRLTVKQVRRAFEVMAKAGVIVTMNRKHEGRVLVHVRSSIIKGHYPIKDDQLLVTVPALEGTHPALEGTHPALEGNSYIGESNRQSKEEDGSLSFAVFSPTTSEEPMAKAKSSADLILAQFQAKKAGETVSDKLTATGMYETWRHVVVKHQGVKFVKPFTMIELGQMSRLIKTWGGQAQIVLAAVLKDWVAFTVYAEKNAGAFKSPLQPTIPYLVKFSGAGMNFYLEARAANCKPASSPGTNTASAPTPKPLDEPQKPATLSPVDEDAPASLEDILAMEQALKSTKS